LKAATPKPSLRISRVPSIASARPPLRAQTSSQIDPELRKFLFAAIRQHCGDAALQKLCKIGARREGFFADELSPEDSDLAADVRVTRVKDLRPCSAVDQQQFFRSHQK
jgi:hypothetical protein